MIDRRRLFSAAGLLLLPARAVADAAARLQTSLSRDLFFVKAKVGKAEGLFLLDTGAPVTVLDLAFARGLGAKAEDWQVLKGAGGDSAAWRAAPLEVQPAGGPLVKLSPSMTDLSYITRGMGMPLAGVIGCDLLGRFGVILDYRTGQAELLAPGELRRGEGALPMRMARTPFIQATVKAAGRSVAGEFQIDTGSNTAVELWRPFADKAFPNVGAQTGAVLGVAGSERSRRGRVDALTVGGLTIPDLEANFANETRPDDAGSAHGGIIGGPAWRGLRVTLDFPDRLFWTS